MKKSILYAIVFFIVVMIAIIDKNHVDKNIPQAHDLSTKTETVDEAFDIKIYNPNIKDTSIPLPKAIRKK